MSALREPAARSGETIVRAVDVHKSFHRGSERIEVLQVAIDEYGKVPEMIDKFMERIREIGPNPYKGF